MKALGLDESYQPNLDGLSLIEDGRTGGIPTVRQFASLPLASQLSCIESISSTKGVQYVRDVLAFNTVGSAHTPQNQSVVINQTAPSQALTEPLVPRARMDALGPIFNVSSAASADIDFVNGTQPKVCLNTCREHASSSGRVELLGETVSSKVKSMLPEFFLRRLSLKAGHKHFG
jgi:hypothetical protein